MGLYETVVIARQDLSANQVDQLADQVTEVITQGGGKVTKKEYWGLRGLAYRMKKNRKGHYFMLNVDTPPPALHEAERRLRLNEDVLRYMSIRVEELEDQPSAMMQKNERSERPERGGRRGERGDRGGDRGDRGGDRGDRGGDRGDRGGDRGPRGGERRAEPTKPATEA